MFSLICGFALIAAGEVLSLIPVIAPTVLGEGWVPLAVVLVLVGVFTLVMRDKNEGRTGAAYFTTGIVMLVIDMVVMLVSPKDATGDVSNQVMGFGFITLVAGFYLLGVGAYFLSPSPSD